MCSVDEVQKIVKESEARIKEDIHKEVPAIVNAELGAFLRKKVWVMVTVVFLVGGSWVGMGVQISHNTEQIKQLRADVKDDIADIKLSLKAIEAYMLNSKM